MANIRLLSIIFVFLFLIGCIEQQSNNTAFFCPQENCEERVLIAINNAEHSIDAAIYSFTSKNIASALITAQKRGINPRIIIDSLQSKSKYSQDEFLMQNNIETRIMSSTMHNKFVVIDNSLVITGSYNWTKNANSKNNENIVFIQDKETAELFSREFFDLWIKSN